jgi:hypothetical protein
MSSDIVKGITPISAASIWTASGGYWLSNEPRYWCR